MIMRLMMFLAVMATSVLLPGCTIMPHGANYAYEERPVLTPDDSSGIVYFLRESAFVGGGASYFIYEDDQKIGLLASGTYFVHQAKLGKHIYIAGDDLRSAVSLEIQPGQTYYMVSWVSTPGILGAPPLNLKEIPPSVAERALPQLKYIRMKTE